MRGNRNRVVMKGSREAKRVAERRATIEAYTFNERRRKWSAVTVTGRFRSSSPNIQNLPVPSSDVVKRLRVTAATWAYRRAYGEPVTARDLLADFAFIFGGKAPDSSTAP